MPGWCWLGNVCCPTPLPFPAPGCCLASPTMCAFPAASAVTPVFCCTQGWLLHTRHMHAHTHTQAHTYTWQATHVCTHSLHITSRIAEHTCMHTRTHARALAVQGDRLHYATAPSTVLQQFLRRAPAKHTLPLLMRSVHADAGRHERVWATGLTLLCGMVGDVVSPGRYMTGPCS